MTIKISFVLSLSYLFVTTGLVAQNNSPVYFTGLGRALVTNDRLSDNTNDSTKQKSSGGYTILDLGINAKLSDMLRASVILRTQNQFGGFYGDGALLKFRQMQIEGLIAKKVKYDIGDIYLTHTPYTLWNNDAVFGYNKYESSVFEQRRGIVNYENFFVGNAWRMQGVNLKGQIDFKKGIEAIGLRVYGGRTMPTNFNNLPDRYFYGGRVDLIQSKYFRVAGNLAGISDIVGTVQAAGENYSNNVYTADLNANTADLVDKFKFTIKGEGGISQLRIAREVDSLTHKYNVYKSGDYFYDVGWEIEYKPWNLKFGMSNRNVGYNFNSPMAQTRRVVPPSGLSSATLTSYPLLNNGTGRQTTLFDSYSQQTGLYNQSISTTLMNYYMQYDIVEPYGRATPNRKGTTIDLSLEDPKKVLQLSGQATLLSEIVSEGDSITHAKRKFTKITGGFVFNLNKLIDFEKTIAITGGIRTESSIRKGADPVNLKNSLLDLGLDMEVFKGFHLLGGAKIFAVKGNEFQSTRDQINNVTYKSVNFNETQHTIVGGIKYDFDAGSYFSMNYQTNKVSINDNSNPAYKFNLNQWFFVFGLKF